MKWDSLGYDQEHYSLSDSRKQKLTWQKAAALLYTSLPLSSLIRHNYLRSSASRRVRIGFSPSQREKSPYISNVLQRFQKGYQMKQIVVSGIINPSFNRNGIICDTELVKIRGLINIVHAYLRGKHS